jgi:hypothetical protein
MTTAASQTQNDTDDCAHVDERAALLTERATEYVCTDGRDPHAWHIVDIAAEIATEAGLPVTRAEIAYRMLEIAAERCEGFLNASDEWDTDDDRAYHRDALETARGCMSAISSDDRGEKPSKWWARNWLRDQGISADGRCRIHEGGTAAPCLECQAAVLAPALVASVAVTADRKVA